jgi:LacI family transcriptional regulator
MGETAARLLLERIEKRRDRAVAMASTPRLATRGSTAPPPGA